jgi:hypothetical protein
MATTDGVGTIYIDGNEWNEIIFKLAPFLKGTEFSIGPIRKSGDIVQIEYAFSEECHPSTWAQPPEWLKKGSK